MFALCSVASDLHSQVRIVNEGALDAIVFGLSVHEGYEQVNKWACELFMQLSNDETLPAVQAIGASDLVQLSAIRFPSSCGASAAHLLESIQSFQEDEIFADEIEQALRT